MVWVGNGADIVMVPQVTDQKERRGKTGREHITAMLFPFPFADLEVPKCEKRRADAVQQGVGSREEFAQNHLTRLEC